MSTCPTCNSPQSHLHPAIQHEGEVEICHDDYHRTAIDALCRSAASFIAEIDASSEDVAAYLRQRFGELFALACSDHREAFDRCGQDARKLVGWSPILTRPDGAV